MHGLLSISHGGTGKASPRYRAWKKLIGDDLPRGGLLGRRGSQPRGYGPSATGETHYDWIMRRLRGAFNEASRYRGMEWNDETFTAPKVQPGAYTGSLLPWSRPEIDEGVAPAVPGLLSEAGEDLEYGLLHSMPGAGWADPYEVARLALLFAGTGVAASGIGRTATAGGAVLGQNAAGGLSFSKQSTAERLSRRRKREIATASGKPLAGEPKNSRIIISAPEGIGLPDMALGRVTFDDWKTRTEHMQTPGEIAVSARWYKEINDVFLRYTGGDKKLAGKYMRAWLVANQNIKPAGAMQNVLLQAEQFARSIPVDQMKAGGMPNPTGAARNVLQGQDIEGGVGQKISDFVDSAAGKRSRSWMGDDTAGGTPFVIDVHSGRDLGLVDQELKNHLIRLGYDKGQVNRLKTDFGASFPETVYENRAGFGRDLTRYLNSTGWQGRTNWTDAEVQAVGWQSMVKLTGGGGQGSIEALKYNTRMIPFEAAPGEGSPFAELFGGRFAALSFEGQAQATRPMVTRAMEVAQKASGVDLRGMVHGTGGWEFVQNPSAVATTLASAEGAEIAANSLGYLLQQTEVWTSALKGKTANPKSFAVDFIEDGSQNLATDEGLRAIWRLISDADSSGLIKGYHPMKTETGEVGIRVLIDKGGEGTHKRLFEVVKGPITEALNDVNFALRVELNEASIKKARNDWNKNPDGRDFIQRLEDIAGGRPQRVNLNSYRREFEGLYENSIAAAEKSAGKAAGPVSKTLLEPPYPPRPGKAGRSNILSSSGPPLGLLQAAQTAWDQFTGDRS